MVTFYFVRIIMFELSQRGSMERQQADEKCHGDNKTNPSWFTHMNVILYLHNLIVKFNFIYDFVISF